MRTFLLLVTLAGCAGPSSHWHQEVQRQAKVPLDCAEVGIAVEGYSGFNYDAVGCERGVRYVCQDRTCAVTDEVVEGQALTRFDASRRVARIRGELDARSADLFAECAIDADAFAVTLFVSASGGIIALEARDGRQSCLARRIRSVTPGSGNLYMHHVFRR